MARLGLILGDQLNENNAVLEALDREHDCLLMGELVEEASYVQHHIQKIILVFLGHAALRIRATGARLDRPLSRVQSQGQRSLVYRSGAVVRQATSC